MQKKCTLKSQCFSLVQFSHSVVSDSLRPHESQQPGLPVHHQLPEFTQTHVHRVGDAIQPSHPMSSPSPPAPNTSQHQGLFQWINSSHEVAKVLEWGAIAFSKRRFYTWSIPNSNWLYSLQQKMENLYTVSRKKTGIWLWLRSSTPIRKIQSKIEESRDNH